MKAPAHSPTKQKVTVLLSCEDWSRLDQHCRDTGRKKSTLIAMLVQEHLDKARPRTEAGNHLENTPPSEPSNSKLAR